MTTIKTVDDALIESLDELMLDIQHVMSWVSLHYGQAGEEEMASRLRPLMSVACGEPTPAVTSAALVRLFGGVGHPQDFDEAANAVHKILRPDADPSATAKAA